MTFYYLIKEINIVKWASSKIEMDKMISKNILADASQNIRRNYNEKRKTLFY